MNRASLASGAVFAATGCIYGASAWLSLPLGSSTDMGPGYFPLALSGILVLLGASIFLRGLYEGKGEVLERLPWRAIFMLSLGILAFAFFIRSLGLFATVLLTTFLASLGNDDVSLWKAAVLSVGIAVLCTLIFGLGIRLPIPIFGAWAGGF